MKKSLILLAGYPATGKTYLTNQIIKRHPNAFSTIAPDDIKEEVWDEIGFDNADEKALVELEVWRRYYARLEESFADGKQVITEYPFSNKQKPTLEVLAERYGYDVLTVRLVGDPRVIYARSYARDLSQDRHLGHLVTHYHRGDVLEDRTQADALVTLDVFLDRCAHKGYDKFCMGELIEVDATDVASIDYPTLLSRIDAFLLGDDLPDESQGSGNTETEV